MREKVSGVISFITYGGGSSKVFIVVYSIRIGGGGGGGGERTMLGGGTSIVLSLPFCIKPDKLIAVDNLNLRIDCPPPPPPPRSQYCPLYNNIAFLSLFFNLQLFLNFLATMLQISPCSM